MMRLNSIRTSTVLVLLFLGILIVLVLGGLWVYSTYDLMKNDIRASNLQDARLISSFVGSFTHDLVADEIVAAGNPATIEAIKSDDRDQLRLIGDSLASTIQGSALIIILDNESNVLYNSRDVNMTEFVTSGLYDAALKKNGSYISGLYYSDSLNDYVFSILTPVMDRGSTVGYIIASVQPEMLDQVIQQQRLNPDRNIIVVDNKGLVVSHDNKTYVEKNTNFSYVLAFQYLMNGTEGVIETSLTYDGKLRIVGFSPVPISGWGVIVSTPMNIVYSQIFRRILEILALLAGLSLLIMAISFIISRYLTKPIVELSDNMRMISAGKYRTRARAERKDEIGDLARAFNSMMDELERTGELERAVELSKKYRLIFQRARDPIFFDDIDGKILDANDAACKTYRYTRDELLSMNAADLRIPEERPKLRDTLKKCFEEGCIYETVHVRKDGSAFPVEISSAGASIGNRPVIVAVIRDITQRIGAEKELRLARFSLDHASDLIFWIGEDGRIHDVNESACKRYGYTCDELCSMRMTDINPDYDSEMWKARWISIKKNGSLTYESTNRTKDGRLFPVEVAAVYMQFMDRELVCAYARDITERKQKEETLRRQAELIDLSPDGIFVRRLDGTIILWSRGAESLYGWAKEEAMGKKSYDLLKKQFPMPLDEINRQLSKAGFWSGEVVQTTKDGRQITVQSRWRAEFDRHGNISEIMESNVDITERKHAEEELAKSKTLAEVYLDLMGHDINNLNQVAIGFLELALGSLDLKGEQKMLIEKPLEALHSSSALIENVMKLQKAKRGEFPSKTVDLCDILKQLQAQYSYMRGRNVTINLVSDPVCYVTANELIRDVFSNLIGNAIKHSDPGKPLVINLKLKKVDIENENYLRVSVEDDGPGIPDELKPKLFMRFQRGDTKAKGKGLGLYLVRSLVEDFHGKVWIEDRVPGDYSKGAKFIVQLPAAEK